MFVCLFVCLFLCLLTLVSVHAESCPSCHVTPTDRSSSAETRIECSVRLSGNWSPSLVISWTDPLTAVHTATALTLVDEDVNVTRSVVYDVSVAVSHQLPATTVYSSELVFHADRRPVAGSATNIPSINCTRNLPHTPRVACKLRPSRVVFARNTQTAHPLLYRFLCRHLVTILLSHKVIC